MGLALGRGLALGTPHQEGKGRGAGLSGRGGSWGLSCFSCLCVCGPCHGLGIPARSAMHGLAFWNRLWEGLGYFGASRM